MNINNFNFIYSIIGLLILKMMTECNSFIKDHFKRQILFKSAIGTYYMCLMVITHNDTLMIFEPKP